MMADFFASAFWTGFLWPLIVMVAQSLLLLVVLLIAIAYILLADRKIWAAVQIRRGPTWSACPCRKPNTTGE
jgi:NADH-quinone oxidoreductase subunit H